MSDSKPSNTIRVRVAVAVTAGGAYSAAGWHRGEDLLMQDAAAGGMEDYDALRCSR